MPKITKKSQCFFLMIVLAFLSLSSCLAPSLNQPTNPQITTSNTLSKAMISSDEPTATYHASQVLKDNGNAVDAVIASVMTLNVTMPLDISWQSGGVCIVTREKYLNEKSRYVNSFVTLYDFSLHYDAHHTPHGQLLNGLLAMHSDYGSQPWSKLVIKAENIARFGFIPSNATKQSFEKDKAMISKIYQKTASKWHAPQMANHFANIRMNPSYFISQQIHKIATHHYTKYKQAYDYSYKPSILTYTYNNEDKFNALYMKKYAKNLIFHDPKMTLSNEYIEKIMSLLVDEDSFFARNEPAYDIAQATLLEKAVNIQELAQNQLVVSAMDNFGYTVICQLGFDKKISRLHYDQDIGIVFPHGHTQHTPSNIIVIRNQSTDRFRFAIGAGKTHHVIACGVLYVQGESSRQCFIKHHSSWPTVSTEIF